MTAATSSEQQPILPSAGNEKKNSSCVNAKCCMICACLSCLGVLLVVVGAYYFLVNFVTGIAIDGFVKEQTEWIYENCEGFVNMSNMADTAWWPGCGYNNFTKPNGCGEPCYSDEWISELRAFDREEKPGRIASYKSRPGKGYEDKDLEVVTLRGWLLPAAKGKAVHHPPPRIVIQHGFTSNSNKVRQIIMAVILRQLGFDVLVNNLRDHCYSDNSTARVVEWGHAYPYDLLGAWDYARRDPDGHLGGELPAAKVGLLGISMGAFTAVNSFSMEGDVPAAWVDSPPSAPGSVFEQGLGLEMASMGISFLGPIVKQPAWKNTEDYAKTKGVDLNEHLPTEMLPHGPETKRPFMIVGNKGDQTVPIEELYKIKGVAEEYPEKYDLSTWVNQGNCHDSSHCLDHLRLYSEYKAKLCVFWRKAFDMSTEGCQDESASKL
uniref:AB hydrolase-1 domain-containing protein n=1 Tax=Strombidinopsis acuminata TaxID=141414 RepID=A0A7S3TED2_9SPIT|mmetsp:Transcript_63500/g.87714  ORF Transcript_63500/g.87714 Transcript_63500/m.87714 type:complete len:435 (+) Transcript_63500:1-1305(+)